MIDVKVEETRVGNRLVARDHDAAMHRKQNTLDVQNYRARKKLEEERSQLREELKKNKNVKVPIERLPIEVTKNLRGAGRKKKHTPGRVRKGINTYFEKCEKTDQIPSMAGLALSMKCTRSYLYILAKQPDLQEVFEYARDIIYDWCSSDVYKTAGQASAKIAYMKNIHGWSEKVEQETTTRDVSLDEARIKISSLMPQLLDYLKRASINQTLEIEKKDSIEAEYSEISPNE